MPTISTFLGIIITMNWLDDSQHHKPHFHARYAEYQASFDLSGELLSGKMPPHQTAFIKAWALLHQDELATNWALAVNGEQTIRIDPLR
jgi:hypothetical protein